MGGVALVGIGSALLAGVFGPFSFGGAAFRTAVAILAGCLVVVGGFIQHRDLRGARIDRASRGKLFVSAAVPSVVVAVIWSAIFLSHHARPRTRGGAAPAGAISAPAHPPSGPIGTILAALPKDTTALAALRVGQLAGLEGLPLDKPGFEGLAAIIDKASQCGIDATKDIELVVFAQSMHHLASTGDPEHARNLVFINGSIRPATLEGCRHQFGSEVATHWLANDIVVIAMSDEDRTYLDELQTTGPKLLENRLFVRHVRQIPADAVGWGWMDFEALLRVVPNDPLPETLFASARARGDRAIDLAVHAEFRDVAVTKAVEERWRSQLSELPQGAIGRLWRYALSGKSLTAHMEVPLTRVTETAAFAVSMIYGE